MRAIGWTIWRRRGKRYWSRGRGHGRNCGTGGATDRAFCKKSPFAKNRERHGRNRGTGGATDRAFCKKSGKARSKPRHRRCNRPCLLQKIGKGTVETAGHRRCNLPCLLQKIVKGTVETAAQTVQPTVPFTKNRQRHGRNRGTDGVADRAFCKKPSKARSKSRHRRCNRPCLLQKIDKGTVETAESRAQPTVPFTKNRQRHGRNCGVAGAIDRAFRKKTLKAAVETATSRHGHPPSRRHHPSPLSRCPDVSACKTPYSFSWPLGLHLVHNALTLYTQSEQGAFTASPDEEEEHVVNDR